MDEKTVDMVVCARALGMLEAAQFGLEYLADMLPDELVEQFNYVSMCLGELEKEVRRVGGLPSDDESFGEIIDGSEGGGGN